MDFFNDIKATATDVGKTVGRYATTAYEKSKQKLTVIDLKTKLNEAYKQLGKLCYKNSQSDEDLTDEISKKTEEIKALLETIEEIDN